MFFRNALHWNSRESQAEDPKRRNTAHSIRSATSQAISSNLWSDYAGAEGETDEAGEVVNAEALHQLDSMVFDGLVAEFEDEADFFSVFALGNQLEDFTLPRA